jgi:hypothetical protein
VSEQQPVFRQPEQKRKLPINQVCAGCGKVLPKHQWARYGLPGLCDECARGQQADV